ncbi:MAG: SET domain-containing protein-lysine N-methyltransferase [Planctomycetes bacterium]|nr:SET domain-containing protein-lysine N-methyltransferase [Planctomycetota bacterium]
MGLWQHRVDDGANDTFLQLRADDLDLKAGRFESGPWPWDSRPRGKFRAHQGLDHRLLLDFRTMIENTRRTTQQREEAIRDIRGSLAVMRVDGHYRLVATRDLSTGVVLLELEGEVGNQPSRFSVQIGVGLHLDVPAGVSIAESMDRYQWRFLNHSCDPNASFRGRTLIADRPIAAWEQICFDYNTTEFDMDAPFRCHCGSDECCETIRGFRWLTEAQRAHRMHRAAPHLLHAWDQESARPSND